MSGRLSPGAAGNRRRLDRALGMALAALAVPAGLAAAPAAQAQAAPFRAPAGPLVLTRELRRTLADGQQLVVRRRYHIQISASAAGFTVTGDLAGVEVEAPAAMADLAEVERQRPDTGLFPLELDRSGLIVARPAPTETVELGGARKAMTAYLARTDLTPAERTAALGMAARLQAQGQAQGNAWPADLFRPMPGERREQREMTLPDGRSGQVTVTVAASDGPGGVLEHMERRVITELDGTERLSLERWSLAAAP
ncbi:hypothetical protein ACFOD9_12455 [Novosphingobium bradum]|uniref:Uncharacterized protein n=1 Tax=Novosphingobium bradum TaxID=1737444 RepID=A0ABV7IXY5_9SPHN